MFNDGRPVTANSTISISRAAHVVKNVPNGTCFLPLDPAARNIGFGGKLKVTYALMHVDVAIFVATVVFNGGFVSMKENWMMGPGVEGLKRCGGMYGPLIRQDPKHLWRVLWAVFMHAGVLHLLSNLSVWIFVGRLVEPDWGWARFLFIFLISALTGNLLSVALDDYSVSVGSSGGIYGILASITVYVTEFWHSIPLARTCLVYSILGSVFCIASSCLPSVDLYAHLGGFIGGGLGALVTLQRLGFRQEYVPYTTQPPPAPRDGDPFTHPSRPVTGPPSMLAGGTHFAYAGEEHTGIVVNPKAQRRGLRKTLAVDDQVEEQKPKATHIEVRMIRVVAAVVLIAGHGVCLCLIYIPPPWYVPPGQLL